MKFKRILNESAADPVDGAPDAALATARLAARAAQVRAEVPFGLVGAASLVVVAIFVGHGFADSVDPLLLRCWLAALAVTPIALAAAFVFTSVRPPDDAAVMRIWLPFGRTVRFFMNLVVIASPWVLLPGAEQMLQLIMVMLYIWFMATEVLANTDPKGMTIVALIGLPASAGAFLIWQGHAYALPLAAFLVLIGGSLFLLERLLFRMRAEALNIDINARLARAAPPPPPLKMHPPEQAPAGRLDDAGLTPRQTEVLRLLARGLSNKEIARQLAIAPATVKTHVADVIAITGAANRTGAVMQAQALGLLSSQPADAGQAR